MRSELCTNEKTAVSDRDRRRLFFRLFCDAQAKTDDSEKETAGFLQLAEKIQVYFTFLSAEMKISLPVQPLPSAGPKVAVAPEDY